MYTIYFGGQSVAQCVQYFGGYPGSLLTQLFSPRCLPCFETRDIVFLVIQNDHRCIQFIFGGWSVPRCGQYFGGDPGALNTQLFSPRCLSCFETRGIVFWRYKMSIGVYNLFLGSGLFLYVVNILGSLLTQLFSARCLSWF